MQSIGQRLIHLTGSGQNIWRAVRKDNGAYWIKYGGRLIEVVQIYNQEFSIGDWKTVGELDIRR